MKSGKTTKLSQKFKNIKISARYFLLISAALIIATFFITKLIYNSNAAQSGNSASSEESDYVIKRSSNFRFIKPLISAKPENEFEGYSEIKDSVSKYILGNEYKGLISTASVYFRDFDKSNWIVVNPNEKYFYGSLFKIPILMTVLKKEEDRPGYLKNSINYTKDVFAAVNKDQEIKSKRIEAGHVYTYEQLLNYMIVYSDNSSLFVFENILGTKNFLRIYKDLNLEMPDSTKNIYDTTVQNFSVFMEVLFNATYLDPGNSEYAIELMSKSDFKEGIVKGIPGGNSFIAHKFAEAGDITNRQLHETALLYIKDKPYLITIMTKGKNGTEYSKLEPIIQGIARIIYDGIVKYNEEQK